MLGHKTKFEKRWGVLWLQRVKKADLSLPTFQSGYSDLLQGEDEASMNTSEYPEQYEHLSLYRRRSEYPD